LLVRHKLDTTVSPGPAQEEGNCWWLTAHSRQLTVSSKHGVPCPVSRVPISPLKGLGGGGPVFPWLTPWATILRPLYGLGSR
jgi:hypothetical protein